MPPPLVLRHRLFRQLKLVRSPRRHCLKPQHHQLAPRVRPPLKLLNAERLPPHLPYLTPIFKVGPCVRPPLNRKRKLNPARLLLCHQKEAVLYLAYCAHVVSLPCQLALKPAHLGAVKRRIRRVPRPHGPSNQGAPKTRHRRRQLVGQHNPNVQKPPRKHKGYRSLQIKKVAQSVTPVTDGGQFDRKTPVHLRQTFCRTLDAKQPPLKRPRGGVPKHTAVRRRKFFGLLKQAVSKQDRHGLLVRRQKDVVVPPKVCRIL